jgi:hypothetical protein
MGGGYGQRLANVSVQNEPHGHLDLGGNQQGAEPSCPCLRLVRLHRLVLIGIVWRGPKVTVSDIIGLRRRNDQLAARIL